MLCDAGKEFDVTDHVYAAPPGLPDHWQVLWESRRNDQLIDIAGQVHIEAADD